MFCENCGTKIDADAKFCDNCGSTIEASTSNNNEDDNLIGWSPHIDNPIFRKGARAFNWRMIICGWWL